jgi:type II secretory pathway pseudopilin PulG
MLGFTTVRRNDGGDTLIEVIFAITVFSFIVVTAMSLMNQGAAAAQRSLEITTVRQQMDGQAEVLRFLHESYVEAYQSGQSFDIIDGASTPAEEYYKVIQEATGRGEASKFGDPKLCTTRDLKDFILNSRTAKLITTKIQPGVFKAAPIYAQITFITGNQVLNSEGIWIEGIRSDDSVDSTAPGYIDYHIRACWDVPGSNLPMNLGTIVRLYEPRA